ncbi:MAG TPA: hypothetical protein PKG90_05225 [Chitinophagaceae bacterium]|nr:hypothetical protein [Chitinophagaceae bacterium]HNU14292.1 hypothetical protein [Chitinophagaceae bacterium]
MKYMVIYLRVVLIMSALTGCYGKEKKTHDQVAGAEDIILVSMNAVAPAAERDKIKNIVSVANCISPQGSYSTMVHTAMDGYMYFRQEYNYKPEPFEAVIINDTTGYATDNPENVLPKEAVYTIRSHAFHNILLELPQRFHSFSMPDTVQKNKQSCYRIKATDELNNSASLFFDRASGRLSVLDIVNPGNRQETISIRFSDWKNTDQFILPHHIYIEQGGKMYVFDFSVIDINSPAFKKRIIRQGQ